jgi:hypothetical protein
MPLILEYSIAIHSRDQNGIPYIRLNLTWNIMNSFGEANEWSSSLMLLSFRSNFEFIKNDLSRIPSFPSTADLLYPRSFLSDPIQYFDKPPIYTYYDLLGCHYRESLPVFLWYEEII